jgi:hypothetical protein
MWRLLTRVSLAAVLLAGAAGRATAEEPVRASGLTLPTVVYASSAALDLATTYRALQYPGFAEKNPLGAWLDDSPTALVAFSAALDVGVVFAAHRWVAPRHPKLVKVGLYAASAVRFYLAYRNYRQLNDHLAR